MNYLNTDLEPYTVTGSSHKAWYVADKLHRTDGPAVEYDDGTEEWWINGFNMSEAEFNEYMSKGSTLLKNVITNRIELNTETIFDIMGKKYKLVEIV